MDILTRITRNCITLPFDVVVEAVAVAFPWGVVTVVVEDVNGVVFPWGEGVDRWVLYGCGQGSGVSMKPCSVPGFCVLMVCAAETGGDPMPILTWVDQEFWRFCSD